MQVMDCVEVIVEKEKYAKEGIHKGMQGWICLDECVDHCWEVDFPRYGDKESIATISIHENDMKVVPVMDARVNEKIKEQFGDPDDNTIEKGALVELAVEKSEYAKEGAHKEMRGSVCRPIDNDGLWLVDFMIKLSDENGSCTAIHEKDLKRAGMVDTWINKQIKDHYDNPDDTTIEKGFTVELAVEKPEYAKHGAHKGMRGYIARSLDSDGLWLVNFMIDLSDGRDLCAAIHEKDLKKSGMVDAWINEQIKARFGD